MSDRRLPPEERSRIADPNWAAATDPAPDGFDAEVPVRSSRQASLRNRKGLSRGLKFAGLGALTVGVIFGVYVSGLEQPTATGMPVGHPSVAATAAASATPSPTVDAAQAAALKAKVAGNAGDTVSLKALADLYAAAGQWSEAASWQVRLVELNPNNTDARLIHGVYLFNNSDLAGAEKQWLEVVRQQPKQAEAYYDLGFLYLAQTPPQTDKTQQMWQKVIEIAPDSAIAETVASHLSALSAAAATPSASPSNG